MHSQLAKSEVLTLGLLKTQVLQDVTLSSCSSQHSEAAYCLHLKHQVIYIYAHSAVKGWKPPTLRQCGILTKLGSSVILAVRISNITGNRTHWVLVLVLVLVLCYGFSSYNSCCTSVLVSWLRVWWYGCVVCYLLLVSLAGTRPPIPDVPLDEEYQQVILLFHFCTEEDYRKRPDAGDIVKQLECQWVFMYCVVVCCCLAWERYKMFLNFLCLLVQYWLTCWVKYCIAMWSWLSIYSNAYSKIWWSFEFCGTIWSGKLIPKLQMCLQSESS
jgi:hypothetical protein